MGQQAANDVAQAEEAAALEAKHKRAIASADRAMTLAAEAAADPNHDNVALDAAAVDRVRPGARLPGRSGRIAPARLSGRHGTA